MTPRPPGWRSLAALLTLAGATHLARPRIYLRLVPRWLGDPRPWVLWSGVAELACAAGVAVPRTRRAAALATAGLFVAVYPGNVQQAADAHRHRARPAVRAATLVRLPMQVPLVWWAWRLGRTGRGATPSAVRRG